MALARHRHTAAYLLVTVLFVAGLVRVESTARSAARNADRVEAVAADLCEVAEGNRAVIQELIRLSAPRPGVPVTPEAQERREQFIAFVEAHLRPFDCEMP